MLQQEIFKFTCSVYSFFDIVVYQKKRDLPNLLTGKMINDVICPSRAPPLSCDCKVEKIIALLTFGISTFTFLLKEL